MIPQPEQREALPDHPVPVGLAAPTAWRLRVDGLVAQPLVLSLSEVDALGAHTHAADFVCDEGWMSSTCEVRGRIVRWQANERPVLLRSTLSIPSQIFQVLLMVPNQQWEGVAVAAILGRAGVQPAARFLKVYAADFTVLVPLEEALRGGALLARRLNGMPLTPVHGAPLRLVAPGRACFDSVKWVDRLEVLAEAVPTTGETLARTRVQG